MSRTPKPLHREAPAPAGGGATKAPKTPPVRPGFYRGEQYRMDDSVGFLMKQAVDLLSRAIDARMVEHSLTDAQWRPLLMLSHHASVTPTQVARKMGCDSGATTRMLDRLEDKGLLRRVRSTDDRRVLQLELTPEGHQAAAVVPFVIADVLNCLLADLSHAEVEQLRSLLERVVAAGRREAALREGTEGNP